MMIVFRTASGALADDGLALNVVHGYDIQG